MTGFTNRMMRVFGAASIFSLIVAGHILLAEEQEGALPTEEQLEEFYDVFLCEEKNTTAEVGVTPPCTDVISTNNPRDECGIILPRPTIPQPTLQSPSLDYLPIVLINNSGQDVYFTIAGTPTADTTCVASPASYANFGPAPGGPFVTTATTTPATAVNVPTTESHSYKFSDIPQTNGQTIIYIPFLNSATMLFSIGTPLTALTVGAGAIATPPPGDMADLNYPTVYGQVEFSFVPTCVGNQITFDYTCVNYYGLSIYLNLHTDTPLSGLRKDRPSGIYQSREYTLCKLRNALATASSGTASQWSGLIKTMGGKTLRVLAPGTAMTDMPPTFDINYFDDAALGFSWAQDVWTGPNAYYAQPGNTLTLTTTDNTIFNGRVIGGNFVFNASSGPGYQVKEQFSIPWLNMAPPAPFNITTSTAIFNTASFFPGMTYSTNGGASCIIGDPGCCFFGQNSCTPAALDAAATLRGEDITEYLSAAIVAGLIPGKVSTLPSGGFSRSTINNVYYTPNAHLNPPGSTTGPWYDLYSLGLHKNSDVTGNAVYSYAFDDYLYSQAPFNAQVAPSQATNNATTFITIIIGPYSDN